MRKAVAILMTIALSLAPIGALAADETDAEALARMIYGEARGVASDMEKAACVWTVLNRVDAEGYSDTIQGVVKAKGQFYGYSAKHPVLDELLELSEDVLARWEREKAGEVNVGRVLPSDYYWFSGDGKRNRFRNVYRGRDIKYWDWSLPSPYDD
jgi:hypothetical protein